MATRVAERLKSGILRGEYVPGQPLREIELCTTLGTSRVPVREALHLLAGEGLVELRPNRGAFVTSPSKNELDEIADVCHKLEPHLLSLAVPLLRPEQIARASVVLDDLDHIDDPFEWTRGNWKFHLVLYEAAERPLTVEMLTSLRARVDRAALLLVSEKKRRMLLNHEHRAILAAAQSGRTTLAAALLGAHLKSARDEVVRLMEKKG